MGAVKVQGEEISERVDVFCGRFADPAAIVHDVWLRTGCDVTIVEGHGSWGGVPEACLVVTYFGTSFDVFDVVRAMYDVAARHGEEAILVERRPSAAALVFTEQVDWEAVYGTVGEVA